MKKIILLVLLVLLPALAHAASFDPQIKWKTIQSAHFNVHFDEPLQKQAEMCAKYLEEAYDKLTPQLHWKPWGRTEIIVTDNNDQANGMTSTLPYNWIMLRLAPPDPRSVLGDYDNWLRELVFHEYAHVLHLDQYGGVMTVPRWIFGKIISPNGSTPGFLREGVTTFMETRETTRGRGRASYPEMLLRTDVLNNRFLKIDQADGLMWEWPAYQAMYLYGVKFNQFLADKYGEERYFEFHRKMGRTPLLFAINHQSRRVFSDVSFTSEKYHNRYERIRTPGTPESTTFYDLWREWHGDLKKKYSAEKEKVEAEGLTEFTPVAGGETTLTALAASPDGRYVAYSRSRVRGATELHLIDNEKGINILIRKRQGATRIAFSPDSKKFVYSSLGGYKTYNVFSDLYLFDIEKWQRTQLTTGARAFDPSFSPDGKKVVFVKQNGGSVSLGLYDFETKETADLVMEVMGGPGHFENFSSPVFSPDGKFIAVSSWQKFSAKRQPKDVPYEMGQWDIYLYDAATGKLKAKLTDDVALDASPTFSADGKWLYFTSDRSGISNVYRVDVARGMKSTEKITNVLTGVFQPAIPSDGKKMYVQYYNGSGFDIRKSEKIAPIKKSDERKEAIKREDLAQTIDVKELAAIPQVEELKFTPKKYQPFGKSFFLPRFIIPTFFTLNDGVMLGAFTGGTDPLRRHNWTGGVNWRTDLKSFPGYFASYWYNRYKPIFAAGIMDYAVDFGESPTFRLQPDPVGQPDVWVDHKFHLFEGRRRVWGGVTYPITKHAVGLQYFWEYRRPVGCWLYPAEKEWYNFGNYAGFNISYAYGDTERYPSSISSEHGTKLRANFSITDRWLGSAYTMEQRVFVGELREYANMPWANEVLAFKAQGGITFGDEFRQGTFTLGGDLGEGNFAAGGSLYYFPLRGIPVASLTGTRALLFSLEYRFPLINAQRGLGTTPLYVQNIHVAPFVDYGNAWTADYKTWGNGMYFFNDFLLGTGLEARGDFILGHGLPVSGRLGWGIIVVNRDRLLSTTKDPLLKSSIKNGMLILQLGTMF